MEIGQVISSHMTDVLPLCKKKKNPLVLSLLAHKKANRQKTMLLAFNNYLLVTYSSIRNSLNIFTVSVIMVKNEIKIHSTLNFETVIMNSAQSICMLQI